MDVAHLRRVTVDEDPRAFPSKQVYVDRAGLLWWDLHFLHVSLAEQGLGTSKKDWMRWAQRRVPADQAFFRTSATPEHYISNIGTTRAMNGLILATVEASRFPSVVQAGAEWLKHGAARACETLVREQALVLDPAGLSFKLLPGGRVQGFCGAAAALLQRSQIQAVKQWWDSAHAEHLLREGWGQDVHQVADVLHCLLFFLLHRRSAGT